MGYAEQKREANRVSGDWSGPEDDPNIFMSRELEKIENKVWANIRDHHVLRPIPQAQIDAVENKEEFTQNEGYR